MAQVCWLREPTTSGLTLNAVYLLDSSNGNILTTIPQPNTIVFAQPVFAGNHLFVATAFASAGNIPIQPTLTAFIPSALKRAKK